MKKRLSYCMKLNYLVEIFKIPNKLGGGYTAYIPQLGKNLFVGDGRTVDEALKDLEKTKKEIFIDYLKRGVFIPKPIEGVFKGGKQCHFGK